jgi:hypothetical protein
MVISSSPSPPVLQKALPQPPTPRSPTNAFHILLVALLAIAIAIAIANLLHQPSRIIDSRERAPGSHDTLVHQISRDDDPESVHEDKVAPVVELLRARVRQVEDIVVEQGRSVVQYVAVELAERDDELGGVAEGVVDGDEIGGEEGTRAPEDLLERVSHHPRAISTLT